MTQRRSPFHTVLSDGMRPDLIHQLDERRLIEQRVGHFIVIWGQLDLMLSMTIAALARPSEPGTLQRNFLGMRTFNKIQFLRSLLHPAWRDGARLVDLLLEGNRYRNDLAHPVLAVAGSYSGRDHGWHLWKPNKSGGTLDLDHAEMIGKERDARIASAGVTALMAPEFVHAYSADDWKARSLGKAILESPGTWETESDYDAFCHRVENLFVVT